MRGSGQCGRDRVGKDSGTGAVARDNGGRGSPRPGIATAPADATPNPNSLGGNHFESDEMAVSAALLTSRRSLPRRGSRSLRAPAGSELAITCAIAMVAASLETVIVG